MAGKSQGFNIRPYRMRRLREYSKRMSSDRLDVLYDDNVADVLAQQGFQVDEAPRSIYKVAKLYEALEHYNPANAPKIKKSDDLSSGISLAYSCFARKPGLPVLHVLPLNAETIVKVTSNMSGSAGLTSYGCTKAQSQERALNRGIQTLMGDKAPEPCLAFARTQFNDKTRLVWGFPYAMTVIEGLIAYNLLQKFKGARTPMAFATSSGTLGAQIRVSSYHNEWCYSLDMSQFDSSISSKLIHTAFTILRTWYDLTEVEPITGKTVADVFNLVERYFICTPIVMPDSQLYLGKKHGVPSGSYFTQIVDSIVNIIVAGFISSRFKLNVSRNDMFVLGDDLMLWSNRQVDLNLISKVVTEELSIKLHGSEKSELVHYDQPVHYLGRDWENGEPTLALEDVLKRMIYPERFRKYPDDPLERDRQVRLMMISFAGTYKSAWQVVQSCYLPPSYKRFTQSIDLWTYYNHGKLLPLPDGDYLTGLMRYQYKYGLVRREKATMPSILTTYWK